jgi:signal transduction histidine kinase
MLPATTATPVEGRNLRTLRRIVKAASLFVLSSEQEMALARGELIYLSPKAPLVSSVPALWSWLLIAVRFRDRIVGVLAVAPKSVAQIFTPTSESLLRTIANQAALALYCASVSEQFEILRRTQEGQAREQLDSAVAALSEELISGLDALYNTGSPEAMDGLIAPLRALSTVRALKRQPQALRPLVERARQLLRDRLLTRLLEVDLSPTIEVDGDGEALIQIISDLLANALDACPPPGRVGMTASSETDQRLRISVWDGGTGPLVEGDRLLPLVLTPDRRTAAFRQIIAQRLVRAHGWEIVVGRHSGRNSTDILVPTTAWRRRRPAEGTDEEDEAAGSA